MKPGRCCKAPRRIELAGRPAGRQNLQSLCACMHACISAFLRHLSANILLLLSFHDSLLRGSHAHYTHPPLKHLSRQMPTLHVASPKRIEMDGMVVLDSTRARSSFHTKALNPSPPNYGTKVRHEKKSRFDQTRLVSNGRARHVVRRGTD